MTASAHAIEAVKHTCIKGWSATTTGTYRPVTSLVVEFDVADPGPAHSCGIYYTKDFWKTQETAYAECIRVDGSYTRGGKEKWIANLELPSHGVDSIEYGVFCFDHREPQQVKRIYENRGGELYRAIPKPAALPEPKPRAVYARASSLNVRTTRPIIREAAVRPASIPAAETVKRAMARAPLFQGQLLGNAFAALRPYMTILMLRNFATNTWQFKADGLISKSGCIIASPSRPEDPETDQDYVNHWVRDSALCVQEAALADLPWSRTDLLDDFVTFSQIIQKAAKAESDGGHACFHIDGSIREWGSQSDGPALRVTAVLGLWGKLSNAGRSAAKELIKEDIDYLLEAYPQHTDNLWEEAKGVHFFTRAAQKDCFDQVLTAAPNLGLKVDRQRVEAAKNDLSLRLEEHWVEDHGYYRSTLEPEGNAKGGNVDSSTVMGAVYGNLKTSDPRLLSNAAVVWDNFRTLYSINHWGYSHGLGPVIGRYPEDEYDGTVTEQPNIGHPWPVCTALFAEYYYRVARELKSDKVVTVDDLSRRFYEQIGFTPSNGSYASGSPQFAEALQKLEAAGDGMLNAVLCHSDNLEIGEQFDRYSGYAKSVRNLTWSYATFLSAVRAKQRLAPQAT
jgi:glucoamylase